MAINASRVTVGTTATALATESASSGTGSSGLFLLYNRGTVSVFIGGSGVTTTAGFEVDAGETVSALEVALGETLYGIVASGTCRVDVLRLRGA